VSLLPGTRLGSYEIIGPLGAGGMGEVYRARDMRLDRSVAIKSLPQGFAADPERLARFEREARLLASLNHPNIATIHGVEDVAGAPHLVLEFVEGETLAQRLARGALTVRETLELGVQIASAIEAAHERGIVHRDLKPGNVMLTPAGAVKVLDFGLAKGGGADAGGGGMSASPTRALSATGPGLILGTAAYMSPEQARGREVDRRSDVWSFGCVLFECLTGRQAFAGETLSDVIARILEREPDWAVLPGAVPARLRDLVRRCLVKEMNERPRDIGDLRRELTAVAAELSSPGRAAAPAGQPSLAVLYFENLAGDAENEYFCSGITEDILTDLSKIKGLRVASRNAVVRYRGAPTDIPRVASELGVGAVLEGSVRRAGDRVRITAQLINAADGFHLWAERYDRTMNDVFAVQEEIASSIATALRGALTPDEAERIGHDRPKDVRAYDLYLKGREEYGKYSPESLRRAMELFQSATAADPDYALAWAGIADCHGQMLQWAIASDVDEGVRLGLEAARHAIALNPKLPEAHKAEALVLRFSGDMDGARAALTRAIQADPRFTPALINLAVEHYSRGHLAGAERLVRRALEVDPEEGFASAWLGWLTLYTGRPDESMAVVQRIRKLSDTAFYITIHHFQSAWIHVLRGDLPAAEQQVRNGHADGAGEDLRAVEALIAWHAGRAGDARRILGEMQNSTGLASGTLLVLAAVAAHLGDLDAGAKLMGRRIMGELGPVSVRLDPALRPLAGHPSFAPRRMDATLVWPLEAPMMDPACFALFRDVRIESGRPEGSDILTG
jgi:serine/threonine protein kinase/Tfp pilus assembly protein PilF